MEDDPQITDQNERPPEHEADATMAPQPTPAPRQHQRDAHARYEIGDEVARGGMGAVLQARDLSIKRIVAMKVALDDLQSSPGLLHRFNQEAEVTGQLEHPNIVPVHELGIDEQGRPFYTMKFVRGVTLHDVLTNIKNGETDTIARFPLSHLLTIFQKVCDAIAFAHSKGIVHRDLKPANLMIGEYGEVLVMDWGLAKVLGKQESGARSQKPEGGIASSIDDGSNSVAPTFVVPKIEADTGGVTMQGQVMGTPQFMAPEQAEGKLDEIDARSDIFSLGAILYNILTLHPPVTGDNVQEILRKVRAGEIVHPTAYNPKSGQSKPETAKVGRATMPRPPFFPLKHIPGGRVPESLSAVSMKALALKKEDRYQTVKDLQKDIGAHQGGFATSAEQAGALKLIWLLIKRHKTLFLVSHAALLIVVVVAGAFSLRNAATLRQLRSTSPEFHAQARSLIDKHQFEDALKKISYSISLTPNNAEYHTLKGNILESLFRIEEARDAYVQALRLNKDDVAAQENLKLCQKILAANDGKKELEALSVYELQKAMFAQRRFTEAAALIEHVKGNKELVQATAKAVLQQIGLKAEEIDASRLKMDETGMLELDLSYTSIEDLTLLKGLPLVSLQLHHTKVADLTPLKGMPLKVLAISKTRVKVLSPLRGMPLILLNIGNTPVYDLTPLKGLPLKDIALSGTTVRDISPLRGIGLQSLDLSNTEISDFNVLREMIPSLAKLDLTGSEIADLAPLQGYKGSVLQLDLTPVTSLEPLRGTRVVYLSLYGCDDLHDLRPLAQCLNLKYLILPPNCDDIEFLRRHPSLQRISYQDLATTRGWDRMPTVAEFWKEYDAKEAKGKQ